MVTVADMVANRAWTQTRGRLVEAMDTMLSGLRSGGAVARDGYQGPCGNGAQELGTGCGRARAWT